jgi:hypothetical protein
MQHGSAGEIDAVSIKSWSELRSGPEPPMGMCIAPRHQIVVRFFLVCTEDRGGALQHERTVLALIKVAENANLQARAAGYMLLHALSRRLEGASVDVLKLSRRVHYAFSW